MKTNKTISRTHLLGLLSRKFLPSKIEKNEKWIGKDFKIIENEIESTCFIQFSNIPVKLSDRTIRKFYNNEQVSNHTLSVLVLLALKDDVKFISYFGKNHENKLDEGWFAFERFILIDSEKTALVEEGNDEIPLNFFTDPLLVIYKVLKNKKLYLKLFFTLIYPVVIIIWAIVIGVWDGIDYPLKKSVSVWFGYFFYAISATQLTLFSVAYKELLSKTSNKIRFNNNFKYLLLIVALSISTILHISFLTDDLHGWCESEKGVPSALGIYHFILYTFNLWVIFNYFYYYRCFPRILKGLKSFDDLCENEIQKPLKSLLISLSKLNIIYKNVIISYGVFTISFFISLIRFEIKQPKFKLDDWQWIEIFILVLFYMIFGFVLYWGLFAKSIYQYLSKTKKNLLNRGFISIELYNFVNNLPRTANEIDRHKSEVRNVLIWVITIVIAINLSVISYLHLSL